MGDSSANTLSQLAATLILLVCGLCIGLVIGLAYPHWVIERVPFLATAARLVRSASDGGMEGLPMLENGELEQAGILASPTGNAAASSGRTLAPVPTSSLCRVSTGYSEGRVNIRSGPGMSYGVVATAGEGEELQITGPMDDEGWAAVRREDGLSGYFYAVRWCR